MSFTATIEYHHPTPLNVEAMREALPCLLGEHDFTSFCSVRTDKEVTGENHLRGYVWNLNDEPLMQMVKVAVIHIIYNG